MKGVRPCPYCGSEVEVIRIKDKPIEYFEEVKYKNSGKKKKIKKIRYEKQYRIYCMHCKQTVAAGLKFECETDEEGAERIAQYDAYIADKMKPRGSNMWYERESEVWPQTLAAQMRDYRARYSSRFDPENDDISEDLEQEA